ncbi:MAG: sigma-70 family RNA polymerase sigma factor [Clostridia bacterium]|nr:sigma-70 family RNA polymerase sigma factor [Clostridia bacterium]MBR3844952.1 sigma-70 family RNA polymerase sigma factor [Clostridia bacterium]
MNAARTERGERNLDLIMRAQSEDEETSMLALEAIIEENMGLVRSIALRFRDRGTDYEDLVQIGIIGMMKAVRSFDPGREVVFSTYAVPLIMGEIKRHLRDDGPVKISRVYKRLSAELGRVRNKILTDEGREPSISELAQICGISVEDAAVALETVNPIASLSESYGDDEKLTLESQLASPDREIEKLNDKIALSQAISRLPRDWQKIITLRYYRNLTQQQVANMLGLSQVKVSREEKKILTVLKGELL